MNGSVTLGADLTVNANQTLYIDGNLTTNGKIVTVEGTLIVSGNVSGDVDNNGSMTIKGVISSGNVWSTKGSSLVVNGTQVLGGNDPLFTITAGSGEMQVNAGGYCVRETDKGNSDAGTTGVSVTLNKSIALSAGQALSVKNSGTLVLANGVVVTIADGAGMELYEGATITNVASTTTDLSVSDNAIAGYQDYNNNSGSSTTVTAKTGA